jgi:hypothetical protein
MAVATSFHFFTLTVQWCNVPYLSQYFHVVSRRSQRMVFEFRINMALLSHVVNTGVYR